MIKWVYLVLGGIAGTLLRYVVSGIVYEAAGPNFPYGTLAVNGTGCFIVGFLACLSEEKFILGPELRILLMAGFCGAFTTFSTFMLETANLMKGGETLKALGNVVVSLVVGFALFRLGVLLAELI